MHNSQPTNGFPSPANYVLASAESRAAARAMADAKRESPEVILIGKRASDDKVIHILVYNNGHSVTKEINS